MTLIDRGIFQAPSGYWWMWSIVAADRAISLRTKDRAKAQAKYDRILHGLQDAQQEKGTN